MTDTTQTPRVRIDLVKEFLSAFPNEKALFEHVGKPKIGAYLERKQERLEITMADALLALVQQQNTIDAQAQEIARLEDWRTVHIGDATSLNNALDEAHKLRMEAENEATQLRADLAEAVRVIEFYAREWMEPEGEFWQVPNEKLLGDGGEYAKLFLAKHNGGERDE